MRRGALERWQAVIVAGVALVGCSPVVVPTAGATPIVITQEDVEAPRARGRSRAPVEHRSSERVGFSEGLLFQLRPRGAEERSATKPSYLFGTIHAGGPRLGIPDPVRAALLASERYCMEALFDASSLMTMANRMFLPGERTLRGIVGEEGWKEIGPVLGASPLGPFANKVQPWVAWMILGVPPGMDLDALDLRLLAEAKEAGKAVCELETLDDQLDAVASLTEADQVALLRLAARDYSSLDERFEEAVQIYLNRDLAGMVALADPSDDLTPAERAASERLAVRLLDERNVTMTKRIAALVDEGGSFVAVGAAHLGGSDGILARLAADGCQITRKY